MEKFDSPGNSADSPNAQPDGLVFDSLKEARASSGIGDVMERFDSPGNSADSPNYNYRTVELAAGVWFEIDALRPPPGGWSR